MFGVVFFSILILKIKEFYPVCFAIVVAANFAYIYADISHNSPSWIADDPTLHAVPGRRRRNHCVLRFAKH